MIRVFYTFFVFCIVKCSEEGNCTIRNSFGELIWFCCDNHEFINDTCHECLDGFESVDGMPCELCKNGNYGRKCGKRCTCLENQMCDHIIGCINIEQSVTSDVSGFNNREIIVYTICASIFVFFILLCSVCQRRYTQIYSNLKRYQNTNMGRRNIPENKLQEIALEDVEPIYEMIDESNMIDNLENFRDSSRSVTNITDSISQPDNNGYLTAYQPAHDNNSESSASSSRMDQTLSYSESNSSISDLQERSSGYLNPYQPIVPSADNHEYSYTQKLDDSSSSGSSTAESGYINPYQPMISDIDVHEYKIVHCSHESHSSLADTSVKEARVVCQSPNKDINSDINIHVQENKSSNEILSETVSSNI